MKRKNSGRLFARGTKRRATPTSQLRDSGMTASSRPRKRGAYLLWRYPLVSTRRFPRRGLAYSGCDAVGDASERWQFTPKTGSAGQSDSVEATRRGSSAFLARYFLTRHFHGSALGSFLGDRSSRIRTYQQSDHRSLHRLDRRANGPDSLQHFHHLGAGGRSSRSRGGGHADGARA